MKLSRRRLLMGAGATLVAAGGVLEALSLRGAFDHRKEAGPTAADAYAASLAALSREEALRAGSVLHVGHSTHVLCVAGIRLLTDPWFFDPVAGRLAHERGPAVMPEGLGPLDGLLLSQARPEHADPVALARLDKKIVTLAGSEEAEALLKSLGFLDVKRLPAWETQEMGPLWITAVPGLLDGPQSGFVVQGAGRTVYFAANTALHEDLEKISERLEPTAALLPIDGHRRRGHAGGVMSADDAVVAAGRLKVKAAYGTHRDARFSDPFAGWFIEEMDKAPETRFLEQMRLILPDAVAGVPGPGELVPLPRG